MARLRSVALLAIAAAFAAGLASAARGVGASSDDTLLARHAPLLVLHADERFVPVPVDGYQLDSDLAVRSTDGTWQPYSGPLASAPVGARLDQRACKAADGPAALDCYAGAEAAHAAPPTAYGAVFRSKTRIALQYWLWYPFNLWSQTGSAGVFWQAHEGDWEAVTIVLDRNERPLLVGASRHCSGVSRAWASVPRRGSRPVIRVALGSHANGFTPGRKRMDSSCWPKEANAVFSAFGLTPADIAGNGRRVVPRVVRITASVPSWMRFRGTWGETQYVSFPGNAPLAFGGGPRGPVPHDLWRRPFAEPFAWPTG